MEMFPIFRSCFNRKKPVEPVNKNRWISALRRQSIFQEISSGLEQAFPNFRKLRSNSLMLKFRYRLSSKFSSFFKLKKFSGCAYILSVETSERSRPCFAVGDRRKSVRQMVRNLFGSCNSGAVYPQNWSQWKREFSSNLPRVLPYLGVVSWQSETYAVHEFRWAFVIRRQACTLAFK